MLSKIAFLDDLTALCIFSGTDYNVMCLACEVDRVLFAVRKQLRISAGTVQCAVGVNNLSVFRLQRTAYVIKRQCAGAVQTEVAFDGLEPCAAAAECQIAVSGYAQIFLTEHGNVGTGNHILTDQTQCQIIRRNDAAVYREAVRSITGCFDNSSRTCKRKVPERQRFGFRIVMPAVCIQISGVFTRNRNPSDSDAVILFCRAEQCGIDLTADILSVIERIIGFGFQTSDTAVRCEMCVIRRNLQIFDSVSVLILDDCIDTVSSRMNLDIVNRHGFDGVAFALFEIRAGNGFAFCVTDSRDKGPVGNRDDIQRTEIVVFAFGSGCACRVKYRDRHFDRLIFLSLFLRCIRFIGIDTVNRMVQVFLILRITVAVCIKIDRKLQNQIIAPVEGCLLNRFQRRLLRIRFKVILPFFAVCRMKSHDSDRHTGIVTDEQIIEIHVLADNKGIAVQPVIRQNRRRFAFADADAVVQIDSQFGFAVRLDLAFLAVDDKRDLIGKFVAHPFQCKRNLDLCSQTGLHASEEVVDLMHGIRGIAVCCRDLAGICIIDRRNRECKTVIKAVRIELDFFKPLIEIVAFLDLCREIQRNCVNGLCLVICLRRIDIAEAEFIIVAVQMLQRACFTADYFPCSVRHLNSHRIGRSVRCGVAFLRFDKDTHTVILIIFCDRIIRKRERGCTCEIIRIPFNLCDLIRRIGVNRRRCFVKLLPDNRRLDAADLKMVEIVNHSDFQENIFLLQSLEGNGCFAGFSAEPESALFIERRNLRICADCICHAPGSDGRFSRELCEAEESVILLTAFDS